MRRREAGGFVLVTVLMGATLLVALASSGLILGRTDLQITSNFLTGTQTFYIAEAGINHAWSLLDDGATFDTAHAAGTSSLLTGIAFGAGTYSVTANAVAGADPDALRITATATGPAESRRTLEAVLQRVNGTTNMIAWRESF